MSKFIKTLKFDSVIFDCIIVLGGEFSEFEIFDKLPTATIIAADSGFHNMIGANTKPHILIGDLDSHSDEELEQMPLEIEIVKIVEQETNDFEKAVQHAIRLEKKNLLVVGMNGGYLEHTLNNWSVFAKLSKLVNLVYFEKDRYAISLEKGVQLKTTKNEIISIIPQPNAILSTIGLKWELDNYALSIGGKEGARNVAIGNEITIDVHLGEILLFIDSKLPYTASYN